MTTLEILTVEKIRSCAPCFDVWIEFDSIAEDWTGTIVDILDMDIEHEHKLWCIRKLGILSIRAWQEFAIFCGYQALSYIENPDPRSIAGLKEAELYLNGKITTEEMQIAVNRFFEDIYADDADDAVYYALTAIYYAMKAIKHAAPEAAAEVPSATHAINTDRAAARAARASNATVNAALDADRRKQITKLKELIISRPK